MAARDLGRPPAVVRGDGRGRVLVTVLLLAAVLLTLGAAHAICATMTSTHTVAMPGNTAALHHAMHPTIHVPAASAVAEPGSITLLPVGWLVGCMIAGLACILAAALLTRPLRVQHALSSRRRAGPPTHRRAQPNLPPRAPPSLHVLSISRT